MVEFVPNLTQAYDSFVAFPCPKLLHADIQQQDAEQPSQQVGIHAGGQQRGGDRYRHTGRAAPKHRFPRDVLLMDVADERRGRTADKIQKIDATGRVLRHPADGGEIEHQQRAAPDAEAADDAGGNTDEKVHHHHSNNTAFIPP